HVREKPRSCRFFPTEQVTVHKDLPRQQSKRREVPIEVHNQARFQYVKEEAALATARFQVRQESMTGRNLKFPAKDASFHNVESVAPGNSQGVAFGPRVQFPAFIERKNL